MRIKVHYNESKPVGYTMWLAAHETYNWAHRAGASWPCSTTSNRRLCVVVDTNGLCDLTVNGRDNGNVDATEIDTIVADHLPDECKHLWPTWNH